MIISGLGSRRRAYRRGQSLVLFALATLVVIAAAIGPLYERAVEQAAVRTTLSSADRISRGLVVRVDPSVTAAQLQPTGRGAQLFQPPVHTLEVPVAVLGGPPGTSTSLVYRDNQCAHIPMASGRCPAAAGEVMLSQPTAAVLHLHVGSTLNLRVPESDSVQLTFTDAPHVVGLYKPFTENDDYWFGASYSSAAGITASGLPGEGTSVDAVFGAPQYVRQISRRLTDLGQDSYVQSYVDLALRPGKVGVDDIPVLRQVLAASAVTRAGAPSQVQSALPDYLAQAESARRAARTVVFAGDASLVLLAAIAFGVAVAAAADQRRPELALARLRGNGIGGATRLFVSELGTLAVAAIVPGVLLSWGLGVAACRVWLVPGVRPEVRLPAVAAVIAAAAVMVVMIAAIGRRASGQQITDMLRQLPGRLGRRGLGIAEAVLLVAAVGGGVVVLSGGRHSAFAPLMPSFLAVVLGVLGSRILVLAARRFGRARFWRGGLTSALAALNLGRRPGARLTITVLSVATALLVFASQQWSVADANRHQRAAAQTGAAVSLAVSTPTVARLIDAVNNGDPSQRWATPVAEIDPPGLGAVPTIAVDPASFGAVASWGREAYRPSARALHSIQPAVTAPPVTFTGTSLQLSLASISQRLLVGAGAEQPDGEPGPPPNPATQVVSVQLDFRRMDGQVLQAVFGPLPRAATGRQTFTAQVPCPVACHLTGIEISRPVLNQDPEAVTFTVAGLSAGGRSLSVGRASDWATTTDRAQIPQTPQTTSMQAVDTPTGVQFLAVDDGTGTSMQYLELPIATPALLAGPRPQTVDALGDLTGATLDGRVARIAIVGTVPFVPQAGPSGVIVDLNLAARSTTVLDPTTRTSVWLRTDDAAREKRLVTALRSAGITVLSRATAAQAAHAFARSAPGWSAQFALVVGVLAEILAIGLLVLSLLTTRRVRQRDLAALRLNGVPASLTRTATALELAVIVVAGVVIGALAGLVGAVVSLPAVPIFTAAATVPLPLSFGLQPLWLVGVVAGSLVVLVPSAAVLGSRTAGRARPVHAVSEGL